MNIEMKKNIVEKLVEAQKKELLYPFAHALLAIFGVEIPRSVVLGEGVCFAHRTQGLLYTLILELVTMFTSIKVLPFDCLSLEQNGVKGGFHRYSR